MISAASVAKPRSAGARRVARSSAARAPMMASRTAGGQSWLVSMSVPVARAEPSESGDGVWARAVMAIINAWQDT
jgi:hypothetical protein